MKIMISHIKFYAFLSVFVYCGPGTVLREKDKEKKKCALKPQGFVAKVKETFKGGISNHQNT